MAQLIQQTLEQERWQREMIEQRYTQYTEDDEEVREGTAPPRRGQMQALPNSVTRFPRVGVPGGSCRVPTLLPARRRRGNTPRTRRRR